MTSRALLHLVNEFLPVIGFFIAAQMYSFYTATSILMFLTVVAIAIGWEFDRHFPVLPIISGIFVIISGSITLIYHSPNALIFADSLYYFLFGLTIAVSLIFKVNILKLIFFRVFAMKDIGWKILALRWIIIMLSAGVANEIIRQTASTEIWVHFKVVKVLFITLFGLYQFTLARKYRIPELANAWGFRN